MPTAARIGAIVATVTLVVTSCGDHQDARGEPPPRQTSRSEPGHERGAAPGGWTLITDAPSGVTVALPSTADPVEQVVPAATGEAVTVRNYTALEAEFDIGFNVLDTPGESYSVEAGAEGVAGSIGGTVEESVPVETDGYPGIEAEVAFGDDELAIFRVIVLDEHVVQPLVAGSQGDRDELMGYFDQLVDSIDVR